MPCSSGSTTLVRTRAVVGNLFHSADWFQPSIIFRTSPQLHNEHLANVNLLQLVTHHGTDSLRDLGLLCHNKMLRPVGITVVNGTRSVPYVIRSSHFWINLALVPHGPATVSSWSGTGLRPGVCQPLQ